MLILTRRKHEKVYIGDEIIVVVAEVDRGQVRLGIEAPENVKIYREEIYKRIQKEQEAKVLRALERDLGAASI